MNNDVSSLRRILKSCRTLAVVGLSAEWHRPSFFAAKYMQEKGYRIVPVNPRYAGQTVLGEVCYASLQEVPHADIIRARDLLRDALYTQPVSCNPNTEEN
mgnify:CR=1 FL=1